MTEYASTEAAVISRGRLLPPSWREGAPLDALETPFWSVDRRVMEANLRRMANAAAAANVALRPHIKTHKIPSLALRQLKLGARGIATATTSEAVVMADAGIDDIFVVYPPYDASKRARLVALAQRGVRVGCTVEEAGLARALSAAAAAADVHVDVYLEVNIVDLTGSSGRCGVAMSEAPSVAEAIRDLPNLRFMGIVGYRGVGWLYGAKARPYDRKDIAEEAREEAHRLVHTADAIRARGIAVQEVVAGSTPTAMDVLREPGITEIQPGEYIFYGGTHVGPGVAHLEDCALSIAATVVSTPHPGRAIIDAGAKALAGDIKPDGLPNLRMRGIGIVRRDGKPLTGVVLESLSEEHGTLRLEEAASPLRIGDRLDVVPVHVCTSVNLAEALIVHNGSTVTEVLPVAARGHVW